MRIMQYSARLRTTDTSWTGVGSACWCVVEIHCGVLCSCLATLRPLFRQAFPWLGKSTAHGPSSGRAGYELSGHGPLGSAALASKRRTRAAAESGPVWEDERRLSFGSAEALKSGGTGAELTAWADGGDKTSATETLYTATDGSDAGAPEPAEKGVGLAKPLRIYVQKTMASEEVRSPAGPRA